MKQFLKRSYFRIKYKHKNVVIKKRAELYADTKFEGNNIVGENTIFGGKLGRGSYIGSDCVINANIGRFTCIANKVCIVQGTHPTKDFVSIHPAFFSKKGKCGISFVNQDMYNDIKTVNPRGNFVDIGNDVWIGYRVTILAGVCIGNGAIIGANSTVIRDVPSYAIVAGTPARLIRYRFNDKQISRLESIKWWNFPLEQIKNTVSDKNNVVMDVDKFLDILINNKSCIPVN